MNGAGQVAIGFSTSSPTNTTYPGIHVIGRSTCAPANTMDIAEFSIVEGGTYQSTYERWGDYANMSVDPSDDYTFWFTTEYMNSSNTTKYSKIAAFTLDESCAAPTVSGVSPSTLYEDRGKQLTITGSDMVGCTFDIGGVSGTIVSNDGSTAVVTFPAGNYTNGTLTVANGAGNDTYSVTVNTRNTIPVVSGASATSDNHPTILSAVTGLHAWYGTTAFNAGDLAGTKTINVGAGTYTDEVVLNSELNPTAANPLIIQNNAGDVVTVNASGNDYGFDLNTVDYVQLTGFTVETANLANIYAQGNNVTISYNKTTGSVGGSGIKVETGTPFTVTNNLSYSNSQYGIQVNSANNIIKNNTADDNGGTPPYSTGVTLYYNDLETDVSDWTGINNPWSWYDGGNFHSGSHYFGGYQSAVLELSTPVNISGYVGISITTWVKSTNMNNNSDQVVAEYKIDAGAWTPLFTVQNDHTTYTNEGGIIAGTGTNLYIRYTVSTSNTNEKFYLDDILVTGDEPVPSNTGAGLYVANVAATVENNIFVAKVGNNSYYSLISPGNSVTSDYNTYYTTNTALFDYNGAQNNTGPLGGNESIIDPKFVGAPDYHIFSTVGSYHTGTWPPSTATGGTWTTDASDSPALDGGNGDPFANEPQSGGVINQGAYGNTAQASKSVASVAISWDGSVSTDWQTLNNWTPNTAIPTSTDNITIPNGMPNYPVIDDGTTTAVCNNMTIENAASVTIANNGQMTVSGTITNNAGNAGLVINSDATGTGSLIQNSASGVSATVKQYFAAAGRAWHMLGAPISNATDAIFPNTTYLFDYDESVDDYWTGSVYDSPVNGWTNYTGNLNVAKGFLYNEFAQTLTFTGLLNTSTAGAGITTNYTNHGATAGNGSSYADYDGWNFISNPFTSAIDWTIADAGAANLYDAIYIWDDVAGTYKSYVVGTNSWNGAGTSGGSQYIAAMQGFFVKGDATETAGTLDIPASARVHNSVAFLKSNKAKETQEDFLRLQVSANDYNDELIVRFDQQATNNMDNKLDAYKMFTHYSYVPQIYSIGVDNSTEYSINTLKELEAGESVILPIKVHSTASEYTISVTEFNYPNIKVYLLDNNTESEYSLNAETTLTFNLSSNDEVGRYSLKFVKSPTAVSDINGDYNITVYPNPNEGSFYFRVNNYTGKYNLTINSITGKLVYSNNFAGKNYNIIDLKNATGGVYLISVKLSNGVVMRERIVIK